MIIQPASATPFNAPFDFSGAHEFGTFPGPCITFQCGETVELGTLPGAQFILSLDGTSEEGQEIIQEYSGSLIISLFNHVMCSDCFNPDRPNTVDVLESNTFNLFYSVKGNATYTKDDNTGLFTLNPIEFECTLQPETVPCGLGTHPTRILRLSEALCNDPFAGNKVPGQNVSGEFKLDNGGCYIITESRIGVNSPALNLQDCGFNCDNALSNDISGPVPCGSDNILPPFQLDSSGGVEPMASPTLAPTGTITPPTPTPIETPDPTVMAPPDSPTPTPIESPDPTATVFPTPTLTPRPEYTDNAPPEFNLTIESEQSCGCGDDSPHFGGIAIASAECPSCLDDSNILSQDSGSVYLHNGEAFLNQVDLEIPGRGFNWSFERKYRSGITFHGPLGHNWDFNYNRRLLVEDNGDVLRMDGYGRVDRYELQETGFFIRKKSFKTPTGFYTSLTENSDGTFSERDSGGSIVEYSAPDSAGMAMMTALYDRNNNAMSFEYNDQGRLSRVIDTLGRPIDYIYDEQKRLIEVRDFSNRSIKFGYDANNDLVSVTSPSVTDTPNGNNFPDGKTTRFTYSSGFEDKTLRHNLLTITAPNEVASDGEAKVQFEYETDPDSPDKDRVIRQVIGGTNVPAVFANNSSIRFDNEAGVPSGGTIQYEYEAIGNDLAEDDFVSPVTQTTVTDRNGNDTEYQFNQLGNVVRIREFTNRDIRPNDPEFFETSYEYNMDGELLKILKPEGNSVEKTYDVDNASRFQQGNVLFDDSFPDEKRGGDQGFVFTDFSYEPIYNQVRTTTDARANDPDFEPQNGGPNSFRRYTTSYTFDYQEGRNFSALAKELGVSDFAVRLMLRKANIRMGLGDVNGDGRTDQVAGNVIKEEFPTVNLLSDSNMVGVEGGTKQSISKLIIYNDFGQMIKEVDPEGNVTVYDYYPENDPDGDGADLTDGVSSNPFGYNKEITRDTESDSSRNSGTDPKPANIRMQYFYDSVGNVVKEIDGRGIATEYSVNQLNQVVQTMNASDVSAAIKNPEEPEGNEAETGIVAFKYIENTFYDFNDNVILYQIEDRGNTSNAGGNNEESGTAFVDYTTSYDILDQPVKTTEEVSDNEILVTQNRYDPNGNPVLTILPEGNAVSFVFDERDLVFQSTRGATLPPEMALLNEKDITNYDVRGGDPSTMTYHYDLNRNVIETVDAADTDGSVANNSKRGGLGDRTRFIYDGFDRQTSTVDSVGNQSITQYDPVGNVVRVSVFGPVGAASPTSDGPDNLAMPVSSLGVVQADNLVNKNLMQASETLYDELNRAFQKDGVLFVNSIPTVRKPDVKDGASDIGKGNLTPDDNQAIPGITGTDIIGRVTTRREYDRNSRATFTLEDDGDTSSVFYDGVGRVIKSVDPEGNIVETEYDDNSNVIETRETDVSQVTDIPDELFLSTIFYDSLNRTHRTVDNIGQTFDYRYDSRDNLVAIADPQGPVNDAFINRRAFDNGTLTENKINDFGNVSVYSYDGINRKTRVDVVLTASGDGDGVNIGATLEGVKTKMPTPDISQSTDGLITVSYEWDKNSFLTALTDDNGNQTQYTYDNLNRRLTEKKGISVLPNLADRDDPDTIITVEYDSDDNALNMTDENGSVINCQYDAINRRVACNITRAPTVIGTTAESYEYDGLSRFTSATDNNSPDDKSDDSHITFAWDSLSRAIEETQQIGGLSAKVVSSSWRAENLKTKCIYPNGRQTDYTYDDLDRLNTIIDNGEDKAIVNYHYIGMGRVAERSYPINDTRMTYLDDTSKNDSGYDGLRRPVQLRHLGSDNKLIVGFTHTYDRMNNKLNEEKLHAKSDSELYSYDSAYRLTNFDRGLLNTSKDTITTPGANVPLHSNWAHDGVGNWNQVDSETRQHSSFNEIVEINDEDVITILSDNNGNETDDGTFEFEWDYKNRLRTATRKSNGTIIATYTYDAANRRIRKIVVNSDDFDGTTDFNYDAWQVLEERDVSDSMTKQYVYGVYIDEPLTMDKDNNGDGNIDETFFYHCDAKTYVTAMTDASGNLLEQYTFDAYGKPSIFDTSGSLITISQISNPYLFTARRIDLETGIYYYRARYFDPERGRFNHRDGIGYVDSMNLYEYVSSNPINKIDPTGKLTWKQAASNIGKRTIKYTMIWENCKEGGDVFVRNMYLQETGGLKSTVAPQEYIGKAAIVFFTSILPDAWTSKPAPPVKFSSGIGSGPGGYYTIESKIIKKSKMYRLVRHYWAQLGKDKLKLKISGLWCCKLRIRTGNCFGCGEYSGDNIIHSAPPATKWWPPKPKKTKTVKAK